MRDKKGRFIKIQEFKKNCLFCNNKFTFNRKKRLNTARFCSRKCYHSFGHSTETKKKMSFLHTGQKAWNKNIPINLGSLNGNWKGGITPLYRKIRNSFEYEEWRRKVFERDLYTCQYCGEIGGYLQADHIKPFALYPELRLELSNGRTLCIECHYKVTYGKPMPPSIRVWGHNLYRRIQKY